MTIAVAAGRMGQRLGSDPSGLASIPRLQFVAAASFGAALVFAGGASRADEPLQIVVRLAAIAAVLVLLWPLDLRPLRANSKWLAMVAAVYALVLVQLVPLPPGLWAKLPGRDVYAQIAETAGAVRWRPLSLTPDLTLNSLLALIPATAAGVAAIMLGPRGRRRIWAGVALAAVFSAVLGLLQLFAGADALRLYRETSIDSPVGIFANRNHQAFFLACALPPIGTLAGLRLRESGRAAPAAILGLGAVALLMLAVIATASRSGIVVGAVGALAAYACFRMTGVRIARKDTRSRLIAVAIVGSLLGVAAIVAARLGVVDRFLKMEPASDTRAEMLQPLLRTAEAFMPVGSGFGSFDTAYRRFEPDHLLSTIYMNQAHNEPLQLAIEGGVPALLLLAAFLAWWLRATVRIARSRLPSPRRSFAMCAVAVTAMLMSASLVDYPLRTPLLGALFMLACVEILRADALTGSPSNRS